MHHEQLRPIIREAQTVYAVWYILCTMSPLLRISRFHVSFKVFFYIYAPDNPQNSHCYCAIVCIHSLSSYCLIFAARGRAKYYAEYVRFYVCLSFSTKSSCRTSLKFYPCCRHAGPLGGERSLVCTIELFCCCSPDHITEDEARSALRSYVAENCCYGKAAVNGMTFDKIAASNAYHVRTFRFR